MFMGVSNIVTRDDGMLFLVTYSDGTSTPPHAVNATMLRAYSSTGGSLKEVWAVDLTTMPTPFNGTQGPYLILASTGPAAALPLLLAQGGALVLFAATWWSVYDPITQNWWPVTGIVAVNTSSRAVEWFTTSNLFPAPAWGTPLVAMQLAEGTSPEVAIVVAENAGGCPFMGGAVDTCPTQLYVLDTATGGLVANWTPTSPYYIDGQDWGLTQVTLTVAPPLPNGNVSWAYFSTLNGVWLNYRMECGPQHGGCATVNVIESANSPGLPPAYPTENVNRKLGGESEAGA